MNSHAMHLAATPFAAICSGQKLIESRLNDEKRQLIAIGDIIVFTNRDNPTKAVTVRVTSLLKYPTFHELFTQNDPAKFGGESAEQLETQINQLYSTHEQQQYGVVGIEFESLQQGML